MPTEMRATPGPGLLTILMVPRELTASTIEACSAAFALLISSMLTDLVAF